MDYFDRLVQNAKDLGLPEDEQRLWQRTYELEQWVFIARREDPNFSPYAAVVDGKSKATR